MPRDNRCVYMAHISYGTFGFVAMGSALLFIVRFRLLVYSAGSGVNRVQVVLSGFSMRLFCFVHAKTLCRYGCIYGKSAIISPLIKKQGLDSEILKNYRPVANLSFISNIIEKAIATQIHSHLINNDIVDNFQSAYKTGHSCETALLRVYNDIVTTICRGNGAMLVLLDSSAVFDSIYHDNLFCIL